MDVLFRSYEDVSEQLNRISDALKALQPRLISLKQTLSEEISRQESAFRDKMSEIQNREKRINAFINIASANTTVLNPPPTPLPLDDDKLSAINVQMNVNMNSLVSKRAHASQLYTEATGQLMSLVSDRQALEKKHTQNLQALKSRFNTETATIEIEKQKLEGQALTYVQSPEFSKMIWLLEAVESAFCSDKGAASLDTRLYGELYIGTCSFPLPIPSSIVSKTSKIFTKLTSYYNANAQTIEIPVSISLEQGSLIIADYENGSESTILSGIRNLLLNLARYYGKSFAKICLFDPIRFNSGALGCLSPLCGETASWIDAVPSSTDEMRGKLEAILWDIKSAQNAPSLRPQFLYIFHDFPHGYDSRMVQQIQQICVNAERCGAIVVLTHNKSFRNVAFSEIFQFLQENALYLGIQNFYKKGSKTSVPFRWYFAPKTLPPEIRRRFVEERPVTDLGNDYAQRIGFQDKPMYQKGFRRLQNIPYGVDETGQIQYLDFEDGNFATFLCGASRSGKTTLLHTLITGLISSYHPDDIELWLIDFKMTEFSRYVAHLPPHVRYIVLDESPELVYDIIDRLTEILIRRENIFKGQWQKLENVPASRYMPSIMVIIDEFSVMSQIISESILTIDDNYANKLQLLLSKGAAMGLHFLFSSQGFTTGTRGLTDFSKLQIQQRIAMKTGFQEIRETLDIKSSSDADNRMMEQLDYHYALIRVPMDEHGNRLKSSHVLWIRDYNEQEAMIDALNKSVQEQIKYAPEQSSAYINKQTVIVDGSVYVPFQSSREKIQRFLYSKPLETDECAMFPGIPMRLVALQPVIVSDEFSHNILIIAKAAERQPAASLLISCFESLAIQGKRVEIWASRKDPVFLQIRSFAQQKHYTIRTDLNTICGEILRIKRELEAGEALKCYYILLGFTPFLTDMKYRLQGSSPSNHVPHPQVNYEPRKAHELDLMTQLKLAKAGNALPVVPAIPALPQAEPYNDSMKFHAQSAYDARQDLKFLLVNGPSLGIHFMAQFSNMAEYSQSGLDSELFRHKFVFRASKREVSGLIGAADAAVAEQLQSHSFRYTNGLNSLSYRPYLHPGLSWDGWVIQEGKAINISDEEETYLL